MSFKHYAGVSVLALAIGMSVPASATGLWPNGPGFNTAFPTPMLTPANNKWKTKSLFSIGETLPSKGSAGAGYTPVGILDGLGAYRKDWRTVRVFANHELLNFRGNAYELCASATDCNTTFEMKGARVSFFDINIWSKKIVNSGLAIKRAYDANGNLATDTSFLANNFSGFSRFCSAQLVEPHQFGKGRGIVDRIFFTGEEDGGFFNGVGGADWALDTKTGNLWAIPAFGRGAWENVTQIDTKTKSHVAFILADDTSPFDYDNDGEREAAPLYLYVGKKNYGGDFLDRNGLRNGKLYVWVPKDAAKDSPLEFRGAGNKLKGTWKEVDNTPQPANGSEDGSTGFDEFGYPTQGNLMLQAKALGAFQFSRPEDVSTNPRNGAEFVLASTGVDTFDVDPLTGNGADSFGTIYTMKVKFGKNGKPKGTLKIIYDGDEDPTRALRSPDNLDWADDGKIYVQEDEAEEDTLSGEPLFGPGAANPNEASVVMIDPKGKKAPVTIATVDRSVVIDPTANDPKSAVDNDAGAAGEWESSGILDVSRLFGKKAGTLFLADVQAHGIDDQENFNPESRLQDDDLREGGQLLFLEKKRKPRRHAHWHWW